MFHKGEISICVVLENQHESVAAVSVSTLLMRTAAGADPSGCRAEGAGQGVRAEASLVKRESSGV